MKNVEGRLTSTITQAKTSVIMAISDLRAALRDIGHLVAFDFLLLSGLTVTFAAFCSGVESCTGSLLACDVVEVAIGQSCVAVCHNHCECLTPICSM